MDRRTDGARRRGGIRGLSAIFAAGLLLAGCVAGGDNGFDAGLTSIAAQRMQFTVEAVCLNNRDRGAQDRAVRALGFPDRFRDGEATIYVNPGTLTYVRLGRTPAISFTGENGQTRVLPERHGCSVGSPAVGVRAANRVAGQVLAPRLVDGSDLLIAPLGAGTNADGGAGFFFETLSVTLPTFSTGLTDPSTGQETVFEHPVILVVHS